MTADAEPQRIDTGGGAQVDGNVHSGRDFVGRDQITYIYQASAVATAVDWDKLDFGRYLKEVQAAFVQHMQCFAGARRAQGASLRYYPLRLQEKRQGVPAITQQEIRTGTWSDLVCLPRWVLLLGGPGSGKTTQLLHEAYIRAQAALADSVQPLPIYLSLRRFNAEGVEALLAAAADTVGLGMRAMSELWDTGRRPVMLLLDGADEVPAQILPELVSTLEGLRRRDRAKVHSAAVASRYGSTADALMQSQVSFYGLLLESLDGDEIGEFLERYGVPELKGQLSDRLREALQTPDLCSALAQSAAGLTSFAAPRNVGEIYELLVDRHLFGHDAGLFDYRRVKRPILGEMAYRMLRQERSLLPIDDALEAWLAAALAGIAERYQRKRRVMPDDWNAQALVEELAASTVLQKESIVDGAESMSFTKAAFRDYLAATYLATLDLSSPEVQQRLAGLDPERWFEALVCLLGIRPSAAGLFDALYTARPGLAADLWFENRPQGVAAPALIADRYDEQRSALGRASLAAEAEPVTARLVARLLGSADPRLRLAATNAASQWGMGGLEPLLDAAEDSAPPVRDSAIYALLHLGEPAWQGGQERPWPPLVSVDNGAGLSYRSLGGTRGRIGSLHLLDVPDGCDVDLTVTIGDMDWDPFAVASEFHFWTSDPHRAAAGYFEASREVDWVALLARSRWMAACAASAAQKMASRPTLAGLATTLAQKAARFDQFGAQLAVDLGILWQRLELLGPGVDEEGTPLYERIRSLYSRANRARTFDLAAPKEESSVSIVQTMQVASGFYRAIHIGNWSGEEHSYLEVDLTADRLDGILEFVAVKRLHGADQQFPPTHSFSGALAIGAVRDSEIRGLRIERCYGGIAGLRAKLAVTIDSLADSTFHGVSVEQLLPGDSLAHSEPDAAGAMGPLPVAT